MFVLNLIVVLALISIMIIVHEFGHWIVARRLGFQTPIFGFGLPFGKHIKLGKWKNTEFRFHWFVLGGYVAIPELGDESSEEQLKEMPNLKPMKSFPVWKRAAVASAGVVFNIIFAYLMCLIMVATIGPPSTKGNVVITGLLDSATSGDKEFKPNPIAKNAGFLPNDVILKVNNLPMKDPTQVVQAVRTSANKEITFTIQRVKFSDDKKKKEILTIKVKPSSQGTIGVALGFAKNGEYDKPSKNPLVWVSQSAQVLFEWSMTMLIGLGLMIMNLFGFVPAGSPKIGAGDLHGIIAIVSVFTQAIGLDFREIYRWTAMININLAIINLLPIPALDGGHLLFMFIEKIRGKKLAETVQQRAIQTGFALLLLLMFFVLFNDVKGLMSGKFNLTKTQETGAKK